MNNRWQISLLCSEGKLNEIEGLCKSNTREEYVPSTQNSRNVIFLALAYGHTFAKLNET